MACIVDERALPAKRVVEPSQHVVERVREVGELRRYGLAPRTGFGWTEYALAEVGGGDLGRLVGHTSNRVQRSTGEEPTPQPEERDQGYAGEHQRGKQPARRRRCLVAWGSDDDDVGRPRCDPALGEKRRAATECSDPLVDPQAALFGHEVQLANREQQFVLADGG